MIKITHHPLNKRPHAKVTIPRRGAQRDIEIIIEYGYDKYATIKLVVSPSRAVNPPFCQCISGIDKTWVGDEFKDVDNRVGAIKHWIESALEGVATKGVVTACQSQVKKMLRKLDKEPSQ